MTAETASLRMVYDGWDGYQTSLVRAIAPLSSEHLAWRPAPDMRSVGEVAGHISFGRIEWFQRMEAPGSAELANAVAALRRPGISIETVIADNTLELVRWLEDSWRMIENTLAQWTVADLAQTYPHTYQGTTYAVSRQWTIWRIMSHDIHHGGQLTAMLGAQGVSPLELAGLGGHLTVPAVIER